MIKKILLLGFLSVSAAAHAATFQVTVTPDMRFSPELLQIQVGDVVEFVNSTGGRHTVTADPALAADPANVLLPEGAEPFNSGTIAPGQTFTQTFAVAGLYQYLCLPHERHGMIGRIEVVEP